MRGVDGGRRPPYNFLLVWYMFYFLSWLVGVKDKSFLVRNRYFLAHLCLIVLFSVVYRYISLSGLCSVSESSDLDSFFSCSYYALITEFTIGALNSPRTWILRSLVMLQVLLSFLFLNL